MSPARATRPLRDAAVASVFFAAVTLLMTWPQVRHLGDGMTDIWDAKLVTRILQWDYRQTLRDPLNLFHLSFFHPAKYVLAFSENLWGAALFGFPLLAAGASPLFNYNALFLFAMFLSAVAAWALAREVTGDPIASAVAGFVYAFVPWRFSQLPHFQFQWGAFICLLMLFLLRYLDSGARRDLVLFGVFFAWNALANVHYALFSGFAVGATLLLHAAWRAPESGRRVRRALLAAGLGALAFLPFAIAYRRAAALYGMERYLGELLAFSGRWTDFLSAGEKNKLYGPLTRRWIAPEGDFFPGLAAVALAAIALVRLRRRRTGGEPPSAEPSAARRRAARVLDAFAGILVAATAVSIARGGLRVGPLSLGDPGRLAVFVTAAVAARLALAFPRRSRFRSLADFLRRRALDRRALLFLVLAGVGVVVALGGHTPYYRFLFQSFGAIFRAIRSPARGIVIFHLALAVLAAWGVASLAAGATRSRRLAATAAALLAIGVEYRAFPLLLYPVDPEPAPVDRWLAAAAAPGGVVLWPFGPNDSEYVFRQALHERPLVNGYSGFFPKDYRELEAVLHQKPIPDAVWDRIRQVDGCVLVYHPHDVESSSRGAYRWAAQQALRNGRVELLGAFPHGEDFDLTFRIAGCASWDPRLPAGAAESGRREWEKLLAIPSEALSAPVVAIDVPDEVRAGEWRWGYALDDSGIAEVEIGSEMGFDANAMRGLPRPDLPAVFRDYPDAGHAGFGFLIPRLPRGPHTLVVTVVAKDGGKTVLTRSIRVR